MNMKHRVLLLAAFAALLSMAVYGVSGPAPVAQAQNPHAAVVTHSVDLVADATFSSISQDGILRWVQVTASLGSPQVEPGRPIKGPVVRLVIFEFNTHTQTVTVFAEGEAPAPRLHIDRARLRGATLPLTTVTMVVKDYDTGVPTGQTFRVQIAVSWAGTGEVNFTHSTAHYQFPGIIETTHIWARDRSATAVANTLTFTLPTGTSVNFTGATAEFAELVNGRRTDVVIAH
jgi:hypothetical protein